MATYRARVKEIDIAAIRKDIRPTGHAIGLAAGLPPGTVNAMRNGRPASASTMAAIVRLLGGTVEDYFDLVDDDEDAAVATR